MNDAIGETGASQQPFFTDTATVTPGPFPFCDLGWDFGPVWLAYASACCLGDSSQSKMKPLWPVDAELFMNPDHTVDAEVTCTADQLKLPVRVTFRADERVYNPSSGMFVSRVGPLAQGFTKAEFLATELMLVEGVSVPKKFSLRVYQPNPHGGANNLVRLAAEWEATVRSVRFPSNLVIRLPQLRTNTSVRDFRSKATVQGRLDYGITNRMWLDADARSFHRIEATQRQYERLAATSKSAPLPPEKARVVRFFVLGGLFAISAIGATIVFLTVRRQKQENQKEKNES